MDRSDKGNHGKKEYTYTESKRTHHKRRTDKEHKQRHYGIPKNVCNGSITIYDNQKHILYHYKEQNRRRPVIFRREMGFAVYDGYDPEITNYIEEKGNVIVWKHGAPPELKGRSFFEYEQYFEEYDKQKIRIRLYEKFRDKYWLYLGFFNEVFVECGDWNVKLYLNPHDSHFLPLDYDPVLLKSFIPRKGQILGLKSVKDKYLGIIQMPPGSGKTSFAVMMYQHFKLPTLFLVHRNELLENTRKTISTLLNIPINKVGIVRGSTEKIQHITVASIKTIFQRIRQNKWAHTNSFGMLIQDEAHRVAANQFKTVFLRHSAQRMFGLTATPEGRSDRMDPLISAILGDVIFQRSREEEVKDGHLVPLRIIPITYSLDEVNDYQVFCKLITEDDDLNKNFVQIIKDAPKPCLVLTQRIAHINALSKKLSEMNLKHLIATGQMCKKDRQSVLQKLNKGKINIVVATNIWNEGIDIPLLRSVFIAMPFSSPIITEQVYGRGERAAPGKKECLVFDTIADNAIGLAMWEKRKKIINTIPSWTIEF